MWRSQSSSYQPLALRNIDGIVLLRSALRWTPPWPAVPTWTIPSANPSAHWIVPQGDRPPSRKLAGMS